MLEKWYWIAGIIIALAAVIGLFLKSKSGKAANNIQKAKVSGERNSVSQSSSIRQSGDDEGQ